MTGNHVVIAGIRLVWRQGQRRLRGVWFGNGRGRNGVSIGTVAGSGPAGSALARGGGDPLVQDLAVEFSKSTRQCIDLAVAVALRSVGFGARILARASSWFADFVAGLAADLPTGLRTPGFAAVVAARRGFRAALAALFGPAAKWRYDAGIAALATAG